MRWRGIWRPYQGDSWTNRGKRQSPIRLHGISFENREKRPSSTRRSVFSGVCHARGVITILSTKPTDRARRLANIWKQIEENEKSDPSTGDQLGKRKCLFTLFSTEFRADRWVNGGSNNEPLSRWGDEAFGDLNRVIVGQIEENDKVRTVYGGSVLRIERNGQVRRAGRSSRACATHGV